MAGLMSHVLCICIYSQHTISWQTEDTRSHIASLNSAVMQIEAKRLWKLNEALSLGILSPLASLYAPVAPPSGPRALPHLQWQPDRVFHSSALCASALDSITLPYRLHSPSPTSPLGSAIGKATWTGIHIPHTCWPQLCAQAHGICVFPTRNKCISSLCELSSMTQNRRSQADVCIVGQQCHARLQTLTSHGFFMSRQLMTHYLWLQEKPVCMT